MKLFSYFPWGAVRQWDEDLGEGGRWLSEHRQIARSRAGCALARSSSCGCSHTLELRQQIRQRRAGLKRLQQLGDGLGHRPQLRGR
jgi:hypothetical protein